MNARGGVCFGTVVCDGASFNARALCVVSRNTRHDRLCGFSKWRSEYDEELSRRRIMLAGCI